MSARAVRVLHLSDIHCGYAFVPDHVAAAEALAAAMSRESGSLDAIVVSGDLSQRARAHEFRKARGVLDRFRAIAPLIVVPGNHDTQWWQAPFGLGQRSRLHARWREIIAEETEPTLRVPGVSLIGMNSSAGMLPHALTWNARDWRVKGGLTRAQLDFARERLAQSAPGDLRILVLHHNLVRGRLSRRWGLTRPLHMIDELSALGAHVVCAGHDHEERVEQLRSTRGAVVSSTANTLSSRVRGHRAVALNVIEGNATSLTITVWSYDAGSRVFVAGVPQSFARS